MRGQAPPPTQFNHMEIDMKPNAPDEWVVPLSQLRNDPSVPHDTRPDWSGVLENIERIEGLACEACFKIAMQSKRLQRRMSEIDVLVAQVEDRQRAFLVDYENQVVIDQEKAERKWREYVSDNRLRKEDVL